MRRGDDQPAAKVAPCVPLHAGGGVAIKDAHHTSQRVGTCSKKQQGAHQAAAGGRQRRRRGKWGRWRSACQRPRHAPEVVVAVAAVRAAGVGVTTAAAQRPPVTRPRRTRRGQRGGPRRGNAATVVAQERRRGCTSGVAGGATGAAWLLDRSWWGCRRVVNTATRRHARRSCCGAVGQLSATLFPPCWSVDSK